MKELEIELTRLPLTTPTEVHVARIRELALAKAKDLRQRFMPT